MLVTDPISDPKRVPFEVLSVLTQTRSDAKGIPELAENIGAHGLKTALWIGRLEGEDEGSEYLQGINQVFKFRGAEHTLDDLTFCEEGGKISAYPIIAGHRRYFSLNRLKDVGCEAWYIRWPKTDPSVIFARRFRSVKCTVHHHIDPYYAVELQMSENGYVAPALIDTLDTTKALWGAIHERNPRMTLRAFARQIGVSESTAHDRLAFHDALDIVQKAIYDGVIVFGHGMTLLTYQRKLQVFYKDNAECEVRVFAFVAEWLRRTVEDRYTVATLQHRIKREFANVIAGQRSLNDLFEESEDARQQAEGAIRAIHRAKLLTEQLRMTKRWFDNLRWLKANGLLDKETSGWRLLLARRAFAEALDAMEMAAKDLADDLVPEDVHRAAEIVQRGKHFLRVTERNVIHIPGMA